MHLPHWTLAACTVLSVANALPSTQDGVYPPGVHPPSTQVGANPPGARPPGAYQSDPRLDEP